VSILVFIVFLAPCAVTGILGALGGPRAARIVPLALTAFAPSALAWASFGADGGSNMLWAAVSILGFIGALGAWLGLALTRRKTDPPAGTGLTRS
jgi:hypothetical protein